MNDRELTFRAAAAAGYKTAREADYYEEGYAVLLEGIQDPWNPLLDDGDALRLAVKRRQRIDIRDGVIWVRDGDHIETLVFDGDPSEATRRAIVRAAARMAPKEAT